MSRASAFSNPSARSFEYGRLLGSAQTRSGGRCCVPRLWATAISSNVTTSVSPANRTLEREDIEHAPESRVLLDLFHRPDDAERRIGIVDRHVRRRDGAHPASNPGIDRDVLLAVGADVGDRIADDAGAGLELPQFGAAPRVHRLEPAVHRAEEDHVAAGGEDAAVDGELRVLDAPDLLRLH